MNIHFSNIPLKNIELYTIDQSADLPSRSFKILYILEGDLNISARKRFAGAKCGSQNSGTSENAACRTSGRAGNIFCILPSLNIRLVPAGHFPKSRIIIAAFDTEFISQYVPFQAIELTDLGELLGSDKTEAVHMIEQMAASWYSGGQTRELNLMASCCRFTELLARHIAKLPKDDVPSDRASLISFYLENNYERPVTLTELADSLHLSGAYLSRYIKSRFGMGFQDYLAQIRLEHALDDLRSRDESVTQIALDNGFPNVAALNKVLRQTLDMTPNQYRKKFVHKPSGQNHILSVFYRRKSIRRQKASVSRYRRRSKTDLPAAGTT